MKILVITKLKMWKFVVVHPVSYTPTKKHNLPTLNTTSILPLERQDLKKNERMPDKRKKCWLDYMFLFYHYWIVISPNVIWIDLGSISFWKLTRIWNRKKISEKKFTVLVCSLCKYEYITGNIYQTPFWTIVCTYLLRFILIQKSVFHTV